MNLLRFLILVLCMTLSAAAADVRLTSIEVVGNRRAADQQILAVSRLQTNQTYSETTIEQAVRRVARLPHVFGASYRLTEAEEGGHVLTIQVREQRRYQAGWQTEVFADEHDDFWNDELDFSADWFPGGGHIGINIQADPHVTQDHDDHSIITLTYDHYNIGHNVSFHAFMNVTGSVSDNLAFQGQTFDFLTLDGFNETGIAFGIPLGINHTLDITLSHLSDTVQNWFLGFDDVFLTASQEINGTELNLQYSFDTRHDEVVPLKGTYFRAAAYRRHLDGEHRYREFIMNGPFNITTELFDRSSNGGSMEASWHQPFRDLGSFSTRGEVQWDDTQINYILQDINTRDRAHAWLETAFTWNLKGRDGRGSESFLKAFLAFEGYRLEHESGNDKFTQGWVGGEYTYRGRRFKVNLRALYSP